MKKLLAMTLALALMLAMAIPAFAADFGDIDDVNFDGKFELVFSFEDLVELAEANGVTDPLKDPFTLSDLQFKVTLGSDYVKMSQKTFDDTLELTNEPAVTDETSASSDESSESSEPGESSESGESGESGETGSHGRQGQGHPHYADPCGRLHRGRPRGAL